MSWYLLSIFLLAISSLYLSWKLAHHAREVQQHWEHQFHHSIGETVDLFASGIGSMLFMLLSLAFMSFGLLILWFSLQPILLG